MVEADKLADFVNRSNEHHRARKTAATHGKNQSQAATASYTETNTYHLHRGIIKATICCTLVPHLGPF